MAIDNSAFLLSVNQGPSQLARNMQNKKIAPEKMQKAAEDFEASFISQMLEQMFSEVEKDGLTSDPESEDIYHSMMVEQYGKIISRAGGIGVADYVTSAMLKQQEATI